MGATRIVWLAGAAVLLGASGFWGTSPASAQTGGAAEDPEELASPSPSGEGQSPPPADAPSTPPGDIPPPPPGYGGQGGAGYGAPGGPTWSGAATSPAALPLPADLEDEAAERRRLAQEIAVVEAEYREHGLAMPIVMLAVGGGVALGAGMTFMIYSAEADRCFDACDEYETGQVVTGVLAIAGAGLAVLGLVRLIDTLSDRAPIRERLQALRQRAQELDRVLEPYGQPVAGGAVIGIRGNL